MINQKLTYRITLLLSSSTKKTFDSIEKFFRTAKQYPGLNDCMARKQQNQELHIRNVFFAVVNYFYHDIIAN